VTARRKKKPGRKKIKFDLDQVKKLAGLGAKDKHIAAWFGVHVDTVSDHKRDDQKFRDALERGRSQGDLELLEMAFERAKTRDSLLIFLLKNRLGYCDNPEPQRTPEVLVRFVPRLDGTFDRVDDPEKLSG